MSHTLPETGFVRLKQILGDPRKGVPPIVPICKTEFYRLVKEGIFPSPKKFGKRSLWSVEDVKAMLRTICGGAA